MGELYEIKKEAEGVSPRDVLDSVSGYLDSRDVESLICIGEDVDGNLSVAMSDMTNTEFIGTLNIAMMNYIHNFQHE